MGIPRAATNRAKPLDEDSVEVNEPDFTLDEESNESLDDYDASAMLPSGSLPDLDADDFELPTPTYAESSNAADSDHELPSLNDSPEDGEMMVFSEEFDQIDEELPVIGLDDSAEEPPTPEADELEEFELDLDDDTENEESQDTPEDETDDSGDDLEQFDEDDDEDEASPRGDEDDDEDDESSVGDMAKSLLEASKKGLLATVAFAGGFLKKLPGVGKLITSTTRAAIGLALVIAIPVALIFASAFITRSATAPPESATVSLPDEGGVEMSNMVLNDEGTKLTATLTNTGEVIADVTPSATIKAAELKNPVSWYVRTDVGECTGETANLDIEESVEVTLSCTGSNGSSVKAEGSLE